MDGAIVPLTPLTNRSQKRQFKREALKVAGELEKVNTSFVWHIFHGPSHLTYKQIYEHFLNEWQETIETLAKTKKFETIAIDVLFFEREYKPEI